MHHVMLFPSRDNHSCSMTRVYFMLIAKSQTLYSLTIPSRDKFIP